MTLNLTELRDEPLGTPTVRDGGRRTFNLCAYCKDYSMTDTEMALGDAADAEGVFKIDVVGLSDEALDMPPARCTEFCATVPVQCIF